MCEPAPVCRYLNCGLVKTGHTEYVDSYIPHRCPPRSSQKPPYELRKSDAKVTDRTTFRTDYVTHPITKQEARLKEEYKPPHTAMDGVSRYKQDYPCHKVGYVSLAKPPDNRTLPAAKFEAIPTYSTDFRRWEIPPPGRVHPVQEYKKPHTQMEGTSTFRQDYKHRYGPPRQSARPPHQTIQSDTPIDGNTTHKTSYIRYDVPLRLQRERERYKPPKIPMEGATTFNVEFNEKKGVPAESTRPPPTILASKDPVSSSSEFRDQFIAWPVAPIQRREPAKYKGPLGNMELQTTQRLDYPIKNAQPAILKKPAQMHSQGMPFDGITNYMNDFRKWNVPKTMPKARQEGAVAGGQFDGLSTTRQHYVLYPGVKPSKSCKPENRPINSKSVLDGKTTYKTSYVRQPMEQRPSTAGQHRGRPCYCMTHGLLQRDGANGTISTATRAAKVVS